MKKDLLIAVLLMLAGTVAGQQLVLGSHDVVRVHEYPQDAYLIEADANSFYRVSGGSSTSSDHPLLGAALDPDFRSIYFIKYDKEGMPLKSNFVRGTNNVVYAGSFKGGFTLEESGYVCKELEKRGCSLIVLSGGFTSKTPFYLMRGAVPLKGMIKNGTSWAEKITMALFGPFIIKKYSFSPNFFLDQAKEIRSQVSMPLAYLGGVDSKEGIEEILTAGFEFIAMARPLIHDSNFLLKLESGQITKSECNRCNECIVEMDRGGVKCVIKKDFYTH